MKKLNIKIRTLITLMLCIALLALPLSACSGASGTKESATVNLDESSYESEQSYTEKETAEPAHYAASLSEIPDEAISQMVSQGEDALRASSVDWDENAKLISMDYLGSYFLYAKDWLSSDKNTNIIYMVYRVNATQYGVNEDGSRSDTDNTYYWYIGFYDGMVNADGTFSVDFNNYDKASAYIYNSEYVKTIDGDGFFFTTHDSANDRDITVGYEGFESIDDLFNEIVKSQMGDYTYESTVQ